MSKDRKVGNCRNQIKTWEYIGALGSSLEPPVTRSHSMKRIQLGPKNLLPPQAIVSHDLKDVSSRMEARRLPAWRMGRELVRQYSHRLCLRGISGSRY